MIIDTEKLTADNIRIMLNALLDYHKDKYSKDGAMFAALLDVVDALQALYADDFKNCENFEETLKLESDIADAILHNMRDAVGCYFKTEI